MLEITRLCTAGSEGQSSAVSEISFWDDLDFYCQVLKMFQLSWSRRVQPKVTWEIQNCIMWNCHDAYSVCPGDETPQTSLSFVYTHL